MQFVNSIKNVSRTDIRRFFYFAIVGGFGTILNTVILYLLTVKGGVNYILGSAIATEIAIISNFLGNNFITFRNSDKEHKENNFKEKTVFRKFLSFQLISLITLVGTIFFLWLFVTMFGEQLLLVWNLLAILIMFVANFVLNSMFTWKKINENKNNKKNNDDSVVNKNVKQRLGGILVVTFMLVLFVNSTSAYNILENSSSTKLYSPIGMLSSSKVLSQYDEDGFDILHFDGGNNKNEQKIKTERDKDNEEEQNWDKNNIGDEDNLGIKYGEQENLEIENIEQEKKVFSKNNKVNKNNTNNMNNDSNSMIFHEDSNSEPMMIYASSNVGFENEEIQKEDIQSAVNGDLQEQPINDNESIVQLNILNSNQLTKLTNSIQDFNSSNSSILTINEIESAEIESANSTINSTIIDENISQQEKIEIQRFVLQTLIDNQSVNQSVNDTIINENTSVLENDTLLIENISEIQNITQVDYSSSNIVSVSQLGYHPLSIKQVVVYTSNITGTFNIRDANTHDVVATYALVRPTNYYGQSVNCQGNMPCLVGDFSSFTTQGNFYIEDSYSKSSIFKISENLFEESLPIYLEFFNALMQQNSSYHADMHDNYLPPFKSMADGSFIMEADQAALPLIRLGSAYRKNPELLQYDNYDIYAPLKPDVQEYILNYVEYLEGLQGIKVTEININSPINSAHTLRLGQGFKVNNVFVPGPTNLTTLDIYIPNGNSPIFLETAQVTSLCAENDGSAKWDACIKFAEEIYKCQIDEPCLNLSYNDKIGTIVSDVSANGYEVSRGWGYEFGCFFDVDLNSPQYNNNVNPCQVFYPQTSRTYTAMTLLAYLESYPALNDYSQEIGTRILYKSIKTHEQIKTSFPEFLEGENDAGFYGASLFLLYDYTGDIKYLQEAHLMRNIVSKQFISDITRGNEFYWEEYVRHKNEILNYNLEYEINNIAPEEFFRGKIYNDYKDLGPIAISNNGERVYQFEPNIQFQNSRYILIEGILAQKTVDLLSSPESFMKVVAHNQLSWLTGMNAIQQGVSLNSSLKSMSFIFGIGDDPTQFHSRLLIDTKYSDISNGEVIGARGTGYQFFDPKTEKYYGLDGVTHILGYDLGALGNGLNGEDELNPYVLDQTFNNGLDYIPGWINGAFDTVADTDTIFNYRDSLQVYEFTETTSEITAAAIEYYAYLDADLNNRAELNIVPINMDLIDNYFLPVQQIENITNVTINVGENITNSTNTTTNSTNSTANISNNVTINSTNTTTDIFSNATLNLTNATNTTMNVSANTTTNTTMNVSANTTTNTTMNVTANVTTNITNTSIGNSTNATNGNFTGNYSGELNESIIDSGTNLPFMYEQGGINYYYLQEDDIGQFFITLNSTGEVTWFVDDEIKLITNAETSTFNWEPTIFYVPKAPDYSNIDDATIKAQLSDGSLIEWKVMVENVINPFFASANGGTDVVGSIDTTIRVFTNNNMVDFTSLQITLQSTLGNNIYYLEKVYSSDIESEWRVYIPQTNPGNNYLVEIEGYNNITNESIIYSLEPTRWHYREVKSSSSRGGRSSSRTLKPTPSELIYVLFEKDVISQNESQTIILDAKNFNNEILQIKANVLSPDGVVRIINMQLTNGTNSYGTWVGTFKGFISGKYVLQSVNITDAKFEAVTNIDVNGTSFYYVNEDTISHSNLNIIFVALDKNIVSKGDNITITIDAADSLGVKSVVVYVNSTSGDAFYLPLKLTLGNSNYGTWKSSFEAISDDNTYTIESVKISNANSTLTQRVEQRSVYVNANKIDLGLNGITGNTVGVFSRDYLMNLIKNPIFPTLLGFTIVSIVGIGAFIIIPRRKKEEIETNNSRAKNDEHKINIE